MPETAELRGALYDRIGAILFPVVWALMASAMLVESDIYRYVTVILVVFILVSHGDAVRRASRDWLAILCYAWAAYAAVRFVFGILVLGEKGASEWLYIFPVFFPLVGAALSISRRYIFSAASLLIVCGLVALLLTLDFHTLATGKRATPLFHHNPIHAGIGSCMFFLTAVFWMLHSAETGRLAGPRKWYFLIPGIAAATLSLIGVLGAQSKGVWLALAATVFFMGFLSLLYIVGRRRFQLMGGLLFAAAIAAAVAAPYINRVAGATLQSAVSLVDDSIATASPLSAIQRSIADPATPTGMRERLMLWSNAIELIQAAPWFGWGNAWLSEWQGTTYSNIRYTLIHNGYLEVLVRHGIFGILFIIIFAISAAYSVNYAQHHGVISSSLTVYLYSISFFFFCTIATNSNNRLAIGESFFIVIASAVFTLRSASRKAQGRA